MNIQATTKIHSAWVGAMGWHNKNPLEYLALIGSEIGEAVAEAPRNQITPAFGSELIDIVLRIIDCAHMHEVSLLDEASSLLELPSFTQESQASMTFYDLALLTQDHRDALLSGQEQSVLEQLACLMPDLAQAMNDCRKAERAPTFGRHLTAVCLGALALAARCDIDINEVISAKIESNAQKGNKGRLI